MTAPVSHVDPGIMLDYVTGQLPMPFSVAVACHLTVCRECRADVAGLEEAGGSLLMAAEPEALAPDALPQAMAALPAQLDPAKDLPAPIAANQSWPFPLRRFASGRRMVPWRTGRDVSITELMPRDRRSRALLMEVVPGGTLPRHRHDGPELVFVLTGRYRDSGTDFGAGDIVGSDLAVSHRPTADPVEGCTCFVAVPGPIRFSGVKGQVLNLLQRMGAIAPLA